jgi:hypothetical protein
MGSDLLLRNGRDVERVGPFRSLRGWHSLAKKYALSVRSYCVTTPDSISGGLTRNEAPLHFSFPIFSERMIGEPLLPKPYCSRLQSILAHARTSARSQADLCCMPKMRGEPPTALAYSEDGMRVLWRRSPRKRNRRPGARVRSMPGFWQSEHLPFLPRLGSLQLVDSEVQIPGRQSPGSRSQRAL